MWVVVTFVLITFSLQMTLSFFSDFEDESSLQCLLSVIGAFENMSGHNINLHKSEIIGINVGHDTIQDLAKKLWLQNRNLAQFLFRAPLKWVSQDLIFLESYY